MASLQGLKPCVLPLHYARLKALWRGAVENAKNTSAAQNHRRYFYIRYCHTGLPDIEPHRQAYEFYSLLF